MLTNWSETVFQVGMLAKSSSSRRFVTVKGKAMTSNRGTVIEGVLLALALGVLGFFVSMKERNSTALNTTEQVFISPIDAAAPARTETATFAMG